MVATPQLQQAATTVHNRPTEMRRGQQPGLRKAGLQRQARPRSSNERRQARSNLPYDHRRMGGRTCTMISTIILEVVPTNSPAASRAAPHRSASAQENLTGYVSATPRALRARRERACAGWLLSPLSRGGASCCATGSGCAFLTGGRARYTVVRGGEGGADVAGSAARPCVFAAVRDTFFVARRCARREIRL